MLSRYGVGSTVAGTGGGLERNTGLCLLFQKLKIKLKGQGSLL